VTWLIHTCGVTHLYVWLGWFSRALHWFRGALSHRTVAWLIHTCGMTHLFAWHDLFTYLQKLCDVTHPYVCHVSFLSVTRLICKRAVTWLIHTCGRLIYTPAITYLQELCDVTYQNTCFMTRSEVWHDSFVIVLWLSLTPGVNQSDGLADFGEWMHVRQLRETRLCKCI